MDTQPGQRSVGITWGIATQLLLDGAKEGFKRPGMLALYEEGMCRSTRGGWRGRIGDG